MTDYQRERIHMAGYPEIIEDSEEGYLKIIEFLLDEIDAYEEEMEDQQAQRDDRNLQ